MTPTVRHAVVSAILDETTRGCDTRSTRRERALEWLFFEQDENLRPDRGVSYGNERMILGLGASVALTSARTQLGPGGFMRSTASWEKASDLASAGASGQR
jgi:hypothetical protein